MLKIILWNILSLWLRIIRFYFKITNYLYFEKYNYIYKEAPTTMLVPQEMIHMCKKDIIYKVSCGKHSVDCISEFKGNAVLHHSNAPLFLMDNPNNTELQALSVFRMDNDILRGMKKGEIKTFDNITVEIMDVVEGGIFNE